MLVPFSNSILRALCDMLEQDKIAIPAEIVLQRDFYITKLVTLDREGAEMVGRATAWYLKWLPDQQTSMIAEWFIIKSHIERLATLQESLGLMLGVGDRSPERKSTWTLNENEIQDLRAALVTFIDYCNPLAEDVSYMKRKLGVIQASLLVD